MAMFGEEQRAYRYFSVACLALAGAVVVAGLLSGDLALAVFSVVFLLLPIVVRAVPGLMGLFDGQVAVAEEDEMPQAPPPTAPPQAPRATWARREDLAAARLLGSNAHLTFGRLVQSDEVVGLPREGQVISFCATPDEARDRVLIPNALTYPGSLFVIDRDGAVFHATQRRRREMGQKVVVLDPAGRLGARPETVAVNPLAWLRTDPVGMSEDAQHLADFLLAPCYVHDPTTRLRRESRNLLLSFIVYTLIKATRDDRNLATLRRHLSVPSHRFHQILEEMLNAPSVDGRVSDTAFKLIDMGENARGAVVQACRAATQAFDHGAVARAVSNDGFRLEELLGGNVSLYLIPGGGNDLRPLLAYQRVMLGMAVLLLRRSQPAGAGGGRVLMLVDMLEEMGRFRLLERAWCDRSFPWMSLWLTLSGPGGLMDATETWENVIGCCDVLQSLAPQGAYAHEWVSRLTGMSTFTTDGAAAEGYTPRLRPPDRRPILGPADIAALAPEQQILFMREQAPVLAERLVYNDDALYRGLFDPLPTATLASGTPGAI